MNSLLSIAAEVSGPDFANRSQIERRQTVKLRALLEAILPANPFYARKLGALAAASPLATPAEFSRMVPFTTKQEIMADQRAHPPYGSNLTFPLESYVRCHQTSGSAASPIAWLDTPASWSHIVDNWVAILRAAGVIRSDRFLFAFSFGPFLGFWSALEAALRIQCFCFPSGAMTSLARLQAIRSHGITVLCCTPTYARHLGEVARDAKIDLASSRVRLIIVAGEPGGSIPATRALVEALWPGATVCDHHGMTEVGPVSYQCPGQPGVLHMLESAYLPEVVHPTTGLPVPPGEIGELVLTTLDRIGSPLLRYRTGDLVRARPAGVCACRRHELAVDGGILGRSDAMVIVRGVNVYPGLIEEIVRAHRHITEYRVTLDRRQAMAQLSLEVETAIHDGENPELQKNIEDSLENALNLRVPVQLRPPGFLPRFEMKAQRWIRLTT